MYIKYLGENDLGFPLDCTVGKVYEIVVTDERTVCQWFIDDIGDENYAYNDGTPVTLGAWQVVDKNGEAV